MLFTLVKCDIYHLHPNCISVIATAMCGFEIKLGVLSELLYLLEIYDFLAKPKMTCLISLLAHIPVIAAAWTFNRCVMVVTSLESPKLVIFKVIL